MRSSALAILTLACAGFLAACNNGVQFAPETDEVVDPVDPTIPVPATLTLLASSPQLSSNAVATANGITLTATVKDASNNVIAGQSVGFSTPDAGANLTVTRPITDAAGNAQAVLTIGSSKANRAITVTATAGGATNTVTINVVGTSILISGPANGQFQTPSTFVATLTDSGGAGIAGQSVTFTSAGGSFNPSTAQTTDASGRVTVAFTPTTSNASTTLTATALGVSDDQTLALSQDSFAFTDPTTNEEISTGTNSTVSVLWTRSGNPVVGATVTFSSTRGTVTGSPATTDANGVASITISSAQAGFATLVASGSSAQSSPTATVTAEFVATAPNSISVQVDPSVISTNQNATVSAVVRDAANNLVKNAVVNFSLTDTTGGQLAAPSATTNSQGVASTVYQASSSPSAQNGVTVTGRVCTAGCATAAPTFATGNATLTVGARAARIVLGTGNSITEPDLTYYELPYAVIVTDNAGNPAPDADVRLTITPTFFSKGFYVTSSASGNPVPFETARCQNEDANLNGILDPGEDFDNDGFLDPTNVAEIPSSLELDEEGTATFNIRYPQEYGNWTRVKLSATATVSGTETTETARFGLPISVPDAPNPPGQPSPYGVLFRCDIDDANASQVSFDAVTLIQSATEGTSVIVTVVLDRTFNEDIVVPLAYFGDADSTDFDGPTSVVIPANAPSAQVQIDITADGSIEPAEDLFVTIGTLTNAIEGANETAQITISDP